MSIFGSSNAYLGLDIGTASLKVVELMDRKKRVEVTTYGSAAVTNDLISPAIDEQAVVTKTARVIRSLLEHTNTSADAVVVALPSSISFSTVLSLPDARDAEMNDAVHFAARDVVPANLDDMVLGWSRVGQHPHMDTDQPSEANTASDNQVDPNKMIPIFVTAAPKDVIARYKNVITEAKLDLVALELETFPLARSLLGSSNEITLLVDIGDQITALHVIDQGTPQLSHSLEYGGANITAALAGDMSLSVSEAEKMKLQVGLSNTASADMKKSITAASQKIVDEIKQLTAVYMSRANQPIKKVILIGGGANMKGLAQDWGQQLGIKVQIGNPWTGLAYPAELEATMHELGPTYAVAVGLAQRGLENAKKEE